MKNGNRSNITPSYDYSVSSCYVITVSPMKTYHAANNVIMTSVSNLQIIYFCSFYDKSKLTKMKLTEKPFETTSVNAIVQIKVSPLSKGLYIWLPVE